MLHIIVRHAGASRGVYAMCFSGAKRAKLYKKLGEWKGPKLIKFKGGGAVDMQSPWFWFKCKSLATKLCQR